VTTPRPHIAYVCSDRGVPVGGVKGASLHVAELVRALGSRGADVHLLAARVAESAGTRMDGAVITDVGGSRSTRRARDTLLRSDGGATRGAAEAAAILFNQELGRALERLHRTRPLTAIYERYSLWSFAAAAFARDHGIPYLLEVNAPLPEEQKRYRELENEALAASLERYLISGAGRVLVPSAALIPYAASCGAAPGAVVVVPNAADPLRFRPSRRRDHASGTFVIGFVGSLKPWHGLDDLARAFRRLHRTWKGYRLLVVGDGPLRETMETQLRAWGLGDAVTFTGATDHESVPQWIEKMDVAVAPYPRDAPTYFSPIKLFEYMAAGRPVVASRIGQIPEFLTHRRTALLHKPGAIAELATCVEELRRRPALAEKIAKAARTMVVRNWTWQRNADRVLRLISTIHREAARSGDAATDVRVTASGANKRRAVRSRTLARATKR